MLRDVCELTTCMAAEEDDGTGGRRQPPWSVADALRLDCFPGTGLNGGALLLWRRGRGQRGRKESEDRERVGGAGLRATRWAFPQASGLVSGPKPAAKLDGTKQPTKACQYCVHCLDKILLQNFTPTTVATCWLEAFLLDTSRGHEKLCAGEANVQLRSQALTP